MPLHIPKASISFSRLKKTKFKREREVGAMPIRVGAHELDDNDLPLHNQPEARLSVVGIPYGSARAVLVRVAG